MTTTVWTEPEGLLCRVPKNSRHGLSTRPPGASSTNLGRHGSREGGGGLTEPGAHASAMAGGMMHMPGGGRPGVV